MAENVLVSPYNDLDTVRRIVEEHRDDLTAIIVEPLQRIILPDDDFLPALGKTCDDNDVLLIFDEVNRFPPYPWGAQNISACFLISPATANCWRRWTGWAA